MFDLVYPAESAPLLGASGISRGAEVFPIVEPTGLVVGRSSREVCHSGSMLLHPVVHLHIINRDSSIYLQRRSPKKDLYPNYWDSAVGGHVTYGEQLDEALYREASEELAFTDFNPVMLGHYVFESEREKELVTVYGTINSNVTNPHNAEVAEGRFWTIDEIESAIGHNILTPNFEQEYKQIKNSLLALL